MIINHNITALNTYRQLSINTDQQSKSMAKLSSGLRINTAADDAAGLAISEKMKGQIRGLDQASRNAQDGISLVQTAEGALSETQDILQRMRELSTQASSDTNTNDDRNQIQKEVDQLGKEIDRISNTTEFNTKKLLDGSLSGVQTQSASVTINKAGTTITGASITAASITKNDTFDIKITDYSSGSGNYTITATDALGCTQTFTLASTATSLGVALDGQASVTLNFGTLSSSSIGDEMVFSTKAAQSSYTDSALTFQIGANSGQDMQVDINKMDSTSLGVNGLNVTTSQGANAAITAVDNAINQVSTERAKLGAFENRLTHTINNLNTSSQNITDAQSRIADVDMAKEMMNQSKSSVLAQAAQAMLAQANQQPQQVLQLLRG